MHSHSGPMRLAVMLCLVLAMVLAALAVSAPGAKADYNTAPWGVDQQVTGSGTQYNYSAAALDDGLGNLYVFYIYAGASGNNLLVKKYYDSGTTGAPIAVSSGFPNAVNTAANIVDWAYAVPSWSASAAIDHSGNLYVAWTHISTGSSRQDVYVSKSTDGGLTWPLNSLVNALTTDVWDYAPSVAVAPNGTVYVAWVQQTNGFYNISVSYSSNGGSVWSARKVVTELGEHNALVSQPALAVDATGHVLVAYTRQVGTANWLNLTWTTNGATWTAPASLAKTVLSPYAMPGLLIDSAGRIHIAWPDSRVAATGANLVYYSQSTDDGSSWTTPVPISQGVYNIAGYYNVQMASKGDTLFVGWDTYGGSPNFLLSYAVSGDNGGSWYPEQSKTFDQQHFLARATVDQNGTVYVAGTEFYPSSNGRVVLGYWHSLPSRPVITSAVPGTGRVTLTWTAPAEADIATYRVWRSNDGSTYTLIATVNAPTLTYVDTPLANGTYWYRVEAVDVLGYVSHPPASVFATVGPDATQLNAEINALQGQVANLEQELANNNASIATLQTQLAAASAQIAALQTQLNALQGTANSNSAAIADLQTRLNNLNNTIAQLQNQLNQAQAQQATQTISYANLAFEVIVVVLLVVLLLNQMRKPKSPQMMMAEPAQPPKKPEDEL